MCMRLSCFLDSLPNAEVRFEMRVVAFTKFNLQRQALEAHHINMNAGNNVLNRRGEWGQNLPPKLVVEGEEEKTGSKRNREQGRTSRNKIYSIETTSKSP